MANLLQYVGVQSRIQQFAEIRGDNFGIQLLKNLKEQQKEKVSSMSMGSNDERLPKFGHSQKSSAGSAKSHERSSYKKHSQHLDKITENLEKTQMEANQSASAANSNLNTIKSELEMKKAMNAIAMAKLIPSSMNLKSNLLFNDKLQQRQMEHRFVSKEYVKLKGLQPNQANEYPVMHHTNQGVLHRSISPKSKRPQEIGAPLLRVGDPKLAETSGVPLSQSFLDNPNDNSQAVVFKTVSNFNQRSNLKDVGRP